MPFEVNEDGPIPESNDPFARSTWNLLGRIKDWASQTIRTVTTENVKGIPSELQTKISEGEIFVLQREFRDGMTDFQNIYQRKNDGLQPDPRTLERMRNGLFHNLLKKFNIDSGGSTEHFLFFAIVTGDNNSEDQRKRRIIVDTNTGMIL